MDCDLVSYGTGTPVPNGLTENEAAGLINHFLIDKRVCCFEIVEINPCLDNKQNAMAESAMRILENATNIIEKKGLMIGDLLAKVVSAGMTDLYGASIDVASIQIQSTKRI